MPPTPAKIHLNQKLSETFSGLQQVSASVFRLRAQGGMLAVLAHKGCWLGTTDQDVVARA